MTPIPKLDPNEVVLDGPRFSRLVYRWVSRVTSLLSGGEPLPLRSYTVAQAQRITASTGSMIFVSDEAGGATPAFFDGADWRRTSDRAVIS